MRGSNTVGGFLIVLITFDRICSTHENQRFIPYNLCLYDIQELDYKMFKKVIDEINVMDLYVTKSIDSVIRNNSIGRCKYCKLIGNVIISTFNVVVVGQTECFSDIFLTYFLDFRPSPLMSLT